MGRVGCAYRTALERHFRVDDGVTRPSRIEYGVQTMSVSEKNPAVMIAIENSPVQNKVLRSTDFGKTWHIISLEKRSKYRLHIHQIREHGDVRLEIYDLLGQKVDILTDQTYATGTHRVRWNGSGQASGVYFARMSVDGKAVSVQKIVRR